MLLWDMMMRVSPPATVLPPPAAAQENTKVLKNPDIRLIHAKSNWLHTVTSRRLFLIHNHIHITYCSSVHRTMMRTHAITHNTSTVATVCCLWLVATTASRSACSHLIPTNPGWHLQHMVGGDSLMYQYVLDLLTCIMVWHWKSSSTK